jgi:hypothetical protein
MYKYVRYACAQNYVDTPHPKATRTRAAPITGSRFSDISTSRSDRDTPRRGGRIKLSRVLGSG